MESREFFFNSTSHLILVSIKNLLVKGQDRRPRRLQKRYDGENVMH